MPALRKFPVSAAIAVSAILLGISTAFAYGIGEMPTREKLLTLDTPHFRVIHQEPLAEVAPLVARYGEEAYAVLTEVFGWRPAGKIDLLLVDSFDTHNGWATAVPHNTIMIYAAGSEGGSSIYAPANYLRRTVFHELTHVLTMDMRFGYNKVLSALFGKMLPLGDPLSSALFLFTASPVILSPTWYLEGQAIWAESEFAPPGRGGSTFADMVFRCAVRDGNLLPYSKWYLEIPHWPYGLGAYLYGMRLIQHAEEIGQGENPLGELNGKIARGTLFANSRAARRATGRSFPALARETLRLERVAQKEKLALLTKVPPTPAPRLTPKGMAVGSPVVVDGAVYFLADEEETTSRLYAYDPASGRTKRTSSAQTTASTGSLAVSRRDGTVLYTRLNVQGLENLWYEVRRFDPRTGDDSLVTDRGRYRAVDLAPEGTRMAAVSQRGGKSLLLELDLDRDGRITGERTLLALPLEADLASPRYSPDGARITFVEAVEDGFRLRIHDLATGSAKTLFATGQQIIAPAWHPAGAAIVFSSDLNGVFNLYEIDAEAGGTPAPLTHVTGGLFFPVFAGDEERIYATGYDGHGPHLTEVPYRAPITAPLPSIAPASAGDGGNPWLAELKTRGAAAGRQAAETLPAPRSYNSFANVRFDYWSPWFTASSQGVQGGVAASFSDPTGYQDLKLLAGVESRYGTPLANLQYAYRGLGPTVRVHAAAEQDYFPDLLRLAGTGVRFDHAEEVKRYGLTLELPLETLERRFTLEAGYEYKDRRFIDEVEDDYRGLSLSVSPSEASEGLVWARATYFDGNVFGRSNSIEDGRMISLGGEWADETFGGSLNRSRYLATWNEYLPIPRVKNHVLKLAAAYGFGDGDRIAQGSFGLGGVGYPAAQLTPGLPNTLTLRGYDTNFQVGEKIATAGVAYRFRIWDISRGMEGAFPFYARQLSAEVFYDGGRTWDDRGDGEDRGWISSAGAEVNFALTMFRYLAFAPGIGVAAAPDRDDDEKVQVYVVVKGWVNF